MTNQDKVALVTGGNRGIGFETARQLAKHSVRVLLTARSMAEAEDSVARLNQEGLASVYPAELDITDANEREAAAQLIEQRFGYLDILVNNAGIGAPEGSGTVADELTVNTSEAELLEVFQTNVFAALLLTRELLPLLRKSPAGRIVNVSSQFGSLTLHATRNQAVAYNKRYAYNASKAALNLFTIHLAQELDGTAIKVNSVHPGWVKTRLGTEYAPLTPEEGAKTSVHAALLDAQGPSGAFFHLDQMLPW